MYSYKSHALVIIGQYTYSVITELEQIYESNLRIMELKPVESFLIQLGN
jgi:hypothetical protein